MALIPIKRDGKIDTKRVQHAIITSENIILVIDRNAIQFLISLELLELVYATDDLKKNVLREELPTIEVKEEFTHDMLIDSEAWDFGIAKVKINIMNIRKKSQPIKSNTSKLRL
ncbi:hypothetical protein [Methyloradius palustris]|uniref:Uncharacterized protein n=1 Tax=Methyloradius palustris TaxID=2778876 RepID=A0A8D5JY37_9PROT|nr:hypothetical protein [Methyloradius palustris]BCM24342.1 hypothetical protein ZMTM_06010 [Methyloradius palustris]